MYKKPTKLPARLAASCLLIGLSICPRASVLAQTYCTPTVTGTGFYISNIQFNYSGPGSVYSTGNSGYSATTGSSSKTIPRYHASANSLWYTITNTTATPTTVYLQLFADWNHDGDFNDLNEKNYVGSVSLGASTSTGTGISFGASLDAATGATRLRIIASTSNTITDACAAVVGEVEDYTLTVTSSTAPVLSTAAMPVMLPLLASQTASEGFTINQLVTSTQPSATLIADADDSTSFYVPRGIALTGTTATNGSWQYRTDTSSTWTPVGAVSSTNALLLLGDGGDTRYQPRTRLRFVPTGTGTPTISFRAWDGTAGTNGTYASTAVNGGNSSFSTASNTASLPVVSANPAPRFYLASPTADNILMTSFESTGGLAFSPSTVVSANANLTNSSDMDFDAASNRVVWTESSTSDKIVGSTRDGSSVTVLYSFPNASSVPNGIATGAGKLYFSDNGVGYKGVYSTDLAGGGLQQLTGGAGQLATQNQFRDIEFYNNKLYVITRATASSAYSIFQLDTNGLNPVEVASSVNLIQYLDVAAGTVFWTEAVGGNSGLYSRAITGGSVTTLVSATGRQYRDLQVDTAGNRVYYLDYSNASNILTDRALMSVPFGSGTGGVVKVLTLPESYTSIVLDQGAASVSLGVSLLDFSGQAVEASNRLQWSTSGDAPDMRYTLERSADGKTFSKLAVVRGGTNQYTFEDRYPPAGTALYRLRVQEAGGSETFSRIVSLQRAGLVNGVISVYPNPAQHELSVLGATPRLLELYNMMGQRVATATASARISLEGLPAGTYNLRITLEGTGGILNQRVVKQ